MIHLRFFTNIPLLLASLLLKYPFLVQSQLRVCLGGAVRSQYSVLHYRVLMLRVFSLTMGSLKARSSLNSAWATILSVKAQLSKGSGWDATLMQRLGMNVHPSTLLKYLQTNSAAFNRLRQGVRSKFSFLSCLGLLVNSID